MQYTSTLTAFSMIERARAGVALLHHRVCVCVCVRARACVSAGVALLHDRVQLPHARQVRTLTVAAQFLQLLGSYSFLGPYINSCDARQVPSPRQPRPPTTHHNTIQRSRARSIRAGAVRVSPGLICAVLLWRPRRRCRDNPSPFLADPNVTGSGP